MGEVRLSLSPIRQGLKRVQDLNKPNQSHLLVRMACTLVKSSTRGRDVGLDVHREHMTTADWRFQDAEMDKH